MGRRDGAKPTAVYLPPDRLSVPLKRLGAGRGRDLLEDIPFELETERVSRACPCASEPNASLHTGLTLSCPLMQKNRAMPNECLVKRLSLYCEVVVKIPSVCIMCNSVFFFPF